jgi:hypothetical protein
VKSNVILLLAAGALALAGCSSTPTTVDQGPIRARTFSFVDAGAKPSPAYADSRQVVHTAIQEAIAKNLAARGVTRVTKGGEVIVAYLVLVGNNVSTAAVSDYFGYDRDASGLQDKAHAAHTESKNPNAFEAGTLVIDVIDGKTYQLLKRGHASRPVLRDLPADARAERIQEVVDEILRDLQVKHG